MDTMNRERECAHHLGALLEGAGFEVAYHEFEEGRTTAVARLKGEGGKPPIYFGGHIDVVPLGAKPWSVEPFGGEIVDGKLYGRGISDMKAGIAACVADGATENEGERHQDPLLADWRALEIPQDHGQSHQTDHGENHCAHHLPSAGEKPEGDPGIANVSQAEAGHDVE